MRQTGSEALFEQFLRLEKPRELRERVEAALADPVKVRSGFNFDCFELIIDRAEDVVLLQNVLDA